MRRKVKGRKPDTKKRSGDTWYVYLLRCAGGSLYTGITKDVSRRCQHRDPVLFLPIWIVDRVQVYSGRH